MCRANMVVSLVLVAGVLAGACGPASSGGGSAPAASGGGATSAAGGTPGAATDANAPLPRLPGKVNVAYASVSTNFVPVWLAAEQGLFAKNGLDAEITLIVSGTTAMQSQLAGDVQFVVTSAAEPTSAYVSGAPVQLLMGWSPTLPSVFMVDPSITRPEDLKGKAVGITRFGGLPHWAAKLALRQWGMDPEADVQYLQMGGTPEILAGMQTGAVVGGAYAPPVNIRAQRLGFRTLGDLSQMGIPYLSGVLIGMRPYVEANPEVVRRTVRAFLEALKVSLTDDEAMRSAMAKYSQIDDPEMLAEAITRYRSHVQKVPYPTPEGMQTILNLLGEEDPRARSIRPQDLINTAALEQLEREGFLKQLWGEESPP